MFEFLSPLFLVGLVSAAIPLLIHLSRSRRTKKMQFSTTRFFTDQFLRSYRMSRLKELLLLACRMALFALFALALARPLILPSGQSPLLAQSRSVVLVIDNSASMGYVEEGRSMLDRATAAAKSVIDSLHDGDTASIVLAGRRAAGPEVLFPEPTPALGDVRTAIDNIRVRPLGTDLVGALKRAADVVRNSGKQSKEVYLLSDLQDSGWEIPQKKAAANGEDSDVLVFLVGIRPKEAENLAVTAVQYATSRPMVGAPFSIRPHVRNHGKKLRSAKVSLYIDDEKVGERQITQLQGGRWAVPKFHHTFAKGGWHTGYVEVDDPQVEADNRRYFTFEVVDAVNVLAVNGAPSQIPRLDELFFLKTALAANPEGANSIHLDVTSPAGFDKTDLSKYRAVILANVESLSSSGLDNLEAFVDRGGSLLFCLGDRVNKTFYNDHMAAPTRLHGGLLPGKLTQIEGHPDGKQEDLFIADVDFEHDALAAFADPQFAKLTSVHLRALWGCDPTGSAVLMRVNTGAALLCEKAFGKGRVLLFTSTCDRDWTSFPVRPAFLPWVYRIISYLVQEPLGRQGFYATGDAVPVPVSATEGLTQMLVRTPEKVVKQVTPGETSGTPQVFNETNQPGVYSLYSPGKESEARQFVANLDSFESDLTYLDDVLAERKDIPGVQDSASRAEKVEAGFRELLAGQPSVYYVEGADRLADASLGARRGIRLWDYLLFAALIVALLEPWLANRISLRHYGAPADRAASLAVSRGSIGRTPPRPVEVASP